MPAKTFTVELERLGKTATRDLAAALGGDPAAKAAFASMSSTNRRQYVEWVEDAKRSDTCARRIAAAVERAREGKPRR